MNEEDTTDINFKDIFNNKILFDLALDSINKNNYSKKNIKLLHLDIQDNINYNLITKLVLNLK